MLTSVVFPAPFSPSSPWTSPRRTSKSTPVLAITPGNRLLIPIIRRSGCTDPPSPCEPWPSTLRPSRTVRQRDRPPVGAALCAGLRIPHELTVLLCEVQDLDALGSLHVPNEPVLVLETIGLARRDLRVALFGPHVDEPASLLTEGEFDLPIQVLER